MRFLHPEHDTHRELSLEDVFLVPQFFEGGSRLEMDLRPTDFAGSSHPIVAANMSGVTGKRMVETVARLGGLGVLPQDMALETVERIAQHLHRAHPRIDTALTVEPDATLRDVQGILRKRSHDLVVVVDEAHHPLGVISAADLLKRDQYTPARRLMSREVVTIPADATNEEAFQIMHSERLSAAPVADNAGRLVGVLTKEATVRLELLRPSVGPTGRLRFAAAIGISSGVAAHARALAELGACAIVIDTAHGHQRRMLETLESVRAAIGDSLPIVAGNVCTAEGTRALIEAGADVVKVNVGPGAMCTTRMQTGVGRPSFSSVRACAEVAREAGKHVWADGGVRAPRDVALYLAAGATRVMVGSLLAGTYESPGDIFEDAQGRAYKENYGMASARAVGERTQGLDAFAVAKKQFFREGISSSRIYLKPGQGSVGDLLVDMVTGVQSAMTYSGAHDLASFAERAIVGVQTRGGFVEGTPHGQLIGA